MALSEDFMSEENAAAIRDRIKRATPSKLERVEVADWGGPVWVRVMTGTERDAFEQQMANASSNGAKIGLDNIRARFLIRTLCAEDGTRVFGDADHVELGGKSANVLDRLFQVAQRMNGFGDDAVEELAGN